MLLRIVFNLFDFNIEILRHQFSVSNPDEAFRHEAFCGELPFKPKAAFEFDAIDRSQDATLRVDCRVLEPCGCRNITSQMGR